jgi:hypothetical protein
LKGLLCKAPKYEHEETFDETGVCPIPDGAGTGVFFLDGPAVGPGQEVPEEDVEETITVRNAAGRGGENYLPDVQSLLDGPGFVIEQSTDQEGRYDTTEVGQEANQTSSTKTKVVCLKVCILSVIVAYCVESQLTARVLVKVCSPEDGK